MERTISSISCGAHFTAKIIEMTMAADFSSTNLAEVRYRPRRLGHINLFVSDFRRSMDFYKSVCGFEETARETSSGSGFLSNGNTHHDIGISDLPLFTAYIKTRGLKKLPNHMDRPGLYHFGWEMETEADLVAAYKRALALGLSPRVTDAGTGRSNYMIDPDGYSHQFYVDTKKDWRSVYVGGETILHSNPPWDPLAGEPSRERLYWEAPEIKRVSTAPLHPMRVTHGMMTTNDMPAALRYYSSIGGFDIVHRSKDDAVIYLRGSAARYDVILCWAGEQAHPGLHHAAFEVWPQDDLAAAASQLTRMKVPPAGLYDLPHKESLFIRDPDGLLLEFYKPRGADFSAVDEASPDQKPMFA